MVKGRMGKMTKRSLRPSHRASQGQDEVVAGETVEASAVLHDLPKKLG